MNFGELRSILQPSSEGIKGYYSRWRKLCTLLDAQPETFAHRYLTYIEQHVEHWPTQCKQLPPGWFENEQKSQTWLPLAKTLSLNNTLDWLSLQTISDVAHIERWSWGRSVNEGPWREGMFHKSMLLFDGIGATNLEVDVPDMPEHPQLAYHVLDCLKRYVPASITHLSICNAQKANLLRGVMEESWFTSLESLNFSYNQFGDNIVAKLAAMSMPRLETLALADTTLSDQSAQVLWQVPWLHQIKSLHLGYNPFDDKTMAAFCHHWTDRIPHLDTLIWRASGLTEEGASILAGSEGLRALVELDLWNNDIGAQGAHSILMSPNLVQMRALQMGMTPCGEGIEAASKSNRLLNLEKFGLHASNLGVDGVKSLAQTNFERLVTLDLAYNELTDEGLGHLVDAPWFSKIRQLSLTSNKLSPSSLDHWTWQHRTGEIESLNFSRNNLGDEGMMMLSDWPALQNCRRLILLRNKITAKGIESLVQSPYLDNLEHLDLRGNTIGEEGVQALLNARFLPNLTWLNLRRWDISDEGVMLLVKSPNLPAHLRKYFERFSF